jgi:DNA uptake protein ComE-like DNA-binding protein
MDKKSKQKSGLSESFIMGVIAIVFLIVGYQTALFIHNAAVTKIVADRDQPDTVYVYPQTSEAVRGNFPHSPRAENVRANAPRKAVESFSFNPNTASVDDLCRLGFSQKQAQSIVNYRAKGGTFHRKSDFAESFVVSDSIFKRLEPYIDIPLVDLNVADSAALDALPGIGGWFASKIIEHRTALGGYSYKEQLMDIYRFDQEKYAALADLVIVRPENVKPYPLWTLPADELIKHPYISNMETAKAIVLFRENNPKSMYTIKGLAESGVLSSESSSRLERCVIALPAE